MKIEVFDGAENLTSEQRNEAIAVAKKGVAVAGAGLIAYLIKWLVIGFGLFLLGK